MKGSTFWSESDLSRTTLGRWIHNDIVRPISSPHVRWHMHSELSFTHTTNDEPTLPLPNPI